MPRRTLVVDASVAVKWILPEEDTERALRLQESYQDEEIDLISPYLVVSEVANVVWKRQRRGDFSAAVAQRVFLQFREQTRRSVLRWRTAVLFTIACTWPGPWNSGPISSPLTSASSTPWAPLFPISGSCELSNSGCG